MPINSTVMSLLWADPWKILFASTSDALYELRFSTTPTAVTIAEHGYVVRQEWVEGNIDSTIRKTHIK